MLSSGFGGDMFSGCQACHILVHSPQQTNAAIFNVLGYRNFSLLESQFFEWKQ